jgi:hypothetical protein
MVDATAVGFAGTAIFASTALPAAPGKINLDAGNNQTGVVSQPLPLPLVAVVTDIGHNRLANVPVTFSVIEGGGSFSGQPSLTVNTDSDGRALAVLTLGFQEGIDNNLVRATFPGNTGFPASFTASGRVAGDPAETKVSGVVLDNTNLPIPGVTLRIDGTALSTQSDEQGQFVIESAPVGKVHLVADGSTAQRPGTWPTLEYEVVTISGLNNTIGMPIYLLPLDLPNGLFVDETTGGTLTIPQVPGFSLEVEPGSATFPDGSRSGVVSVTVVHADKIPMTPNFGQQPRFIITIQPAGVLFDPPAPITIPNMDALAPGQVTELYSFDHDLGQFVSIGTGTVSEDGTTIRSDPGVGIIKGGWHCGGFPAVTGSAGQCLDCQQCQGDQCVADEAINDSCCSKEGEQPKVCNSGTCAPVAVEIVDVVTPSDTATPPADNSFISTDSILVQAQVTGGNNLEGSVKWEVRGIDARSGTGNPSTVQNTPTFAFTPMPTTIHTYTPGAGSLGTFDPPLGYDVTATLAICSQDTSDDVSPLNLIRQDERDRMRQEYVNHNLAKIPKREKFVLKSGVGTTHFSCCNPADGYTETAYKFLIFGNMGKTAEGTRAAYNQILQSQGVSGDFGLILSSGYRNPERNEFFRGMLNSSHQFGDALDFKPVNNVDGFNMVELYVILEQAAKQFAGSVICEEGGQILLSCNDPRLDPANMPQNDHLHMENF